MKNQFGCDSLVVTTRSFDPAGISTAHFFQKSCDPSAVGVDTLVFKNALGCDSLKITTTSLAPTSQTFLSEKTCNPALVGSDSVFLKNQFGCDSLVVTTRSFDPAGISTAHFFQKSCDPSAVGVDTLVFKNTLGCDSLKITTTSLAPTSQTLLAELTCNPAAVGSDSVFLKNQFGCDSLVVTTRTFDPAGISTAHFFQKSCDPSAVGTDTLFFKNALGCDSLKITTTSLAPTSQTFLNEKTCNPAAVGSDSIFLKNLFGCDSLVVTTRTFDPAGISTAHFFQKSCDPSAVGIDTIISKNILGCDSLAITATEFAGLEITASATERLCFGEQTGQIRLDSVITGQPPVTVWLSGGPTQSYSGQPISWEKLGGGSYSLTAANSAGCTTTASLNIEEGDPPSLAIAPAEAAMHWGDSLLLEPVSNFTIATAAWTAPAGGSVGCADCPAVFVKAEKTGDFLLRASDPFGCEATASARIHVERGLRLFVPNAMRPGSGGANDGLSIFAGPEVVEVRVLRVFDRSGNQVFEQKDLAPNSASGFDGTFRGRDLPPGVYVWWCELAMLDGSAATAKGDLTLLR